MQDKINEIIELLNKALNLHAEIFKDTPINDYATVLAYSKLIEAKHWFNIIKAMEQKQ
jgi:hypothetical protein